MPAAAVKIEPAPIGIPRRFSVADLNGHGGWVLRRLQKSYPEVHERVIAGWLRAYIDSNEHLFLYLPNAVALAERVNSLELDGKPVVMERFVWAVDKANPDHVAEAASFYGHFAEWAKRMGCGILIVDESSDVPRDVIHDRFGRLYERKQQYVRL